MNRRDLDRLATDYPKLKESWNKYGFDATWDEVSILDAKLVYNQRQVYAALLVQFPGDPAPMVVDFAGHDFAVQNDASDPISLAQFRKMGIVPGVDELVGWPDED